MDEFIELVTQQLGLSSGDSRSATGGIMNFIKEHVGETLFAQISQQLPGVQGLVSDAQNVSSESGGGGGLMGSLASIAGSLLGGKAGSLATIASILAKSGVSLDQSGQFVSMLVGFLKAKLGEDTFSSLASSLPDLIGGGDKA